MRKQKAFTLVELLVAMAIIGVLLGLAIFGLASAQRAQRDTERRAALQDIHIGIQTFYETYSKYPTHIAVTSDSQISFCDGQCTPNLARKTTVPLKGAAVAGNSVNNATMDVIVNFNSATSTAASTQYCLVRDVATVGNGNPRGYTLCAKMENTSVMCVGAGAVKGNTVCGYTIQ